MATLWLDLETYNTRDISVGTYAYAETAGVLLLAWAIDRGPVQVVDFTQTTSPFNYRQIQRNQKLSKAITDPHTVVIAHHAMFDRAVLREVLDLDIPISRWRCSMAQAQAHALPAALSQLCPVLGLREDQGKLKEGKALIQRFCRPAPSNHKAQRYSHESHPDEWKQFCEYARQDVAAMREAVSRMPTWNWGDQEIALWHLDQHINDRGFLADRELTQAGVRAAADEKHRLKARFRELVNHEVDSPTQRLALKQWLNEQFNLGLADTQANTLQRAINDPDTPEVAKEILQLVLQSNKTSTAKYVRLDAALSSDGRFRGGLLFNGAGRTRRLAGRTFQPHNLPSQGLPPYTEIEQYIEALKLGVHDLLFTDQMRYSSAALRGLVIAPEGHKLVVSDLSNIEGRLRVWLAGEEWKLTTFTAFDRGEGDDPYRITASSILGIPPKAITKTQRNVFGKVPELALGYQGGVGAFQQFSNSYQVNMVDYWPTIQSTLDARFIARAHQNYSKWGFESDINQEAWLASEAIKLAWRDRHPATVALWHSCQKAASQALRNPGQVVAAGPRLRFKFVKHSGHPWLLVGMPSKRFMAYFDPKMDGDKLSYMGIEKRHGAPRWERIGTYGGKLVENLCQSLGRDVLTDAMPAVEQAGYRIVLSVHDELVTEAPDTADYSEGDLSRILATNPSWATGLPLAAAGFEAQRYRKD